jgi:hypothetical protein
LSLANLEDLGAAPPGQTALLLHLVEIDHDRS